jgi:GT2 family glycosyltransferase
MSRLKIVIITPVHNRRDETLQCLRSLARSKRDGLDIHIIVVDDGSTDQTSESVLAEFPNVEIVEGDGSLWYTAGTNRGITAALKHDPDYVLAINNDSIFDENCIATLVACAQQIPRSVVGALLLNWEQPHKVFQVSPRWELWRGGFRHWRHQTVWTVPTRPWVVEIIVGNCVLYPTAAIREADLMDEVRLPQYGDAEYTSRMKRLGWRLLIEPRARVFCKPNDPPSGFRKLPLRKQFEKLFRDATGPYSLRRRLHMNLGGAPTEFQGFLAVPISLIRILIGRSQEGAWGNDVNEPPLTETYADSVIDE